MELSRFSAVLIFLMALFVASCGTSKARNISTSDPYFKNIIGKSICTQQRLFLTRWRVDDVRYPDLQQFTLNASVYYESRVNTKPDLSIKEFISKDFTIPPGAYQSIYPVAIGLRLKIENVYSYSSFTHGGYLVMASVSDFPVGSKFVEVHSIFSQSSSLGLLPEYGEFC